MASAVGGIPEIVVPGETGTLVPFQAEGDGSPEPVDADGFSRALAAAEGVAIAEGRGPDTRDDGMAHLVATFARQHAERADPVSDATIDLALRSVELVRDAASWERKEYASDQGRAQCRAEIERLRVGGRG